MTLVVACAIGVGLGTLGVVNGVRRRTPALQQILLALEPGAPHQLDRPGDGKRRRRPDQVVGERLAGVIRARRLDRRGPASSLVPALAICDRSLDELCARCALGALGGVVAPLLLGCILAATGVGLPAALPFGSALVAGAVGVAAPVGATISESRRRRRDAVRIVCSFLDLVVLGLAGGMGIEGALFSASRLGRTDLAQRMHAVLATSRDSGVAPWDALGSLGGELGIAELEELAGAAALAGGEGARIRATLSARAAALRRRDVAEAEAEANAVTERLFLPGTVLLLGFLLFLGYPAVVRIMSGI